jgi:hypothetical protein
MLAKSPSMRHIILLRFPCCITGLNLSARVMISQLQLFPNFIQFEMMVWWELDGDSVGFESSTEKLVLYRNNGLKRPIRAASIPINSFILLSRGP